MSEPTPDGEPEHDPEVLQLAARVCDLARQGGTGTLAAYAHAGVPAHLTDDKGDTLVMPAASHGHADRVVALLERGADPDRTDDRGQTSLAGAVFRPWRYCGCAVWTASRPSSSAPCTPAG